MTHEQSKPENMKLTAYVQQSYDLRNPLTPVKINFCDCLKSTTGVCVCLPAPETYVWKYCVLEQSP